MAGTRLSRRCAGEYYALARMPCDAADEYALRLRGNMLDYLHANHQIEGLRQLEWFTEIDLRVFVRLKVSGSPFSAVNALYPLRSLRSEKLQVRSRSATNLEYGCRAMALCEMAKRR